ncbi:hypothetical protein [Thermococcus barossii]|uniref:hypothetical protein n=1 Tax=Thermococcus barossii TaxID=54077 RepID=UPI0012FDDFA7|nr:hypothetical protein [Thermococcus barossii]
MRRKVDVKKVATIGTSDRGFSVIPREGYAKFMSAPSDISKNRLKPSAYRIVSEEVTWDTLSILRIRYPGMKRTYKIPSMPTNVVEKGISSFSAENAPKYAT